MEPDDELCLCFHVSRRKVEQFIRSKRPRVASQLSECFGAGTGCGWCRPFLHRLHQQIVGVAGEASGAKPIAGSIGNDPEDLPGAAEYAASRAVYRSEQRESADGESDGESGGR
jgi:bacterioferritin-associated ferredoxin